MSGASGAKRGGERGARAGGETPGGASEESDVSLSVSDSDSDIETAYNALVSSSSKIAKASSELYSKIIRQHQLEQAGKSDDSSSEGKRSHLLDCEEGG